MSTAKPARGPGSSISICSSRANAPPPRKVSILGITFELIHIGDELYLKGSPSFYERIGVTRTVPAGSWIKTTVSTTQSSQLASFTNLSREVGLLLTSTGGVTKGQTTNLNGQPVIELKPSGKLYTGKLYIATTGEPYPLKLEKHGRETGTTTFTEWNKPVSVNAPAGALDIGPLERKTPTGAASRPAGRSG